MYNEIYKHYDLIQADKDYELECNFIKESYSRCGPAEPLKILDIGCGTGAHSLILAEDSDSVLGIDISNDMLSIANKKNNHSNVVFEKKTAFDVLQTDFTLVISMFDVLNHIRAENELDIFLRQVKNKLTPGGIFIFDCFNLPALMNDPPRKRNFERLVGDIKVTFLDDEPTFNKETLELKMKNKISIEEGDNKTRFTFKPELTIWPRETITNALTKAGFSAVKMVHNFDLNKELDDNTYKVMFICINE